MHSAAMENAEFNGKFHDFGAANGTEVNLEIVAVGAG